MEKLPARRTGLTAPVLHVDAGGHELKLLITCNYLVDMETGKTTGVKEVFHATPFTEGSDVQGLLIDGCILISLLIQAGVSLDYISNSLSERRPERGTTGPPASIMGSIARHAYKINQELLGEQDEKRAPDGGTSTTSDKA